MGRRAIAWGLILYGVAGLVLIVAGAMAGMDMAGRIERLAGDADGTLAAAASATEAAADSFTSVDASLSEAQESARVAATLSREASGTLRNLAAAMQLSVFGAQPLLPLAGEFSASADQASELAEALDTVSSSLGDTRTDVTRVGVELDLLGDQVTALRTSSGGTDAAPPSLRLFIGLLLAWLAIPAIGGILGGVAMLRSTPRAVTVIERRPPPAPMRRGSVGRAEHPSQPDERPDVQHDPDHQQGP